jgi:RNA polymerase sigma-70 factor (ECF subfamily)
MRIQIFGIAVVTKEMNASERDARAAIEQLYRDHGAAVLRLALRDLTNKADAEDATQEAFLEAFRALERGNQPRLPRQWLFAIAQNVVRRRFRNAPPPVPGLDAERLEAPEQDALAAREILDAVAGVPEAQRSVFLLRELCDLSYDEIAERTGMSVPAVQMQLFRARRRFRAEFTTTRLRVPVTITAWLPRIVDLFRSSPELAKAIPVAITAVAGVGIISSPSVLHTVSSTRHHVSEIHAKPQVVRTLTPRPTHVASATAVRPVPVRKSRHRAPAASTVAGTGAPSTAGPRTSSSPSTAHQTSPASPLQAATPSPSIAAAPTVSSASSTVAAIATTVVSVPSLPLPPLAAAPPQAPPPSAAVAGDALLSPRPFPTGVQPPGAPPLP